MFNIIFAKNELLFDQYKTAMLVTILWKLLEYDPNLKLETPKPDAMRESQHNIEFRGDEMIVDQEFQEKLARKVALLK